MGYLSALDMAMHGSRRAALEWHLRHNHFPAISPDFIEVADQAIDKALEQKWEEPLTLPTGQVKTVLEVIEGMHLEAFIAAAEAEVEDR